jgi:hypothetical protein
MIALRRIFAAFCICLSGVAYALTPGERLVLFSGKILPVFQTNLLLGVLPSQISFSRAGNATMYDSTGKLTYAPNNLLLQSNTFSDAAWFAARMTINSGAADPSGGTTAFTFVPTAVSGSHVVGQNALAVNGNGLQSIVVKASGYSKVALKESASTGKYASFDISGGTYLAGTDDAHSITSLGNGYYRVSMNVNSADSQGLSLYVLAPAYTTGDPAGSSFTGDGTSGVIVYTATVSAVTYETTPRAQDQVITTSAAYYGPRFDYDPATLSARGELLETASRTNIVLWNRDLTNAAWTKSATVTVAKNQTGIDGVANSASSITGGAVSATNIVYQPITLASSTRAQSAWVKRLVGSGVVNMTTDGGTTWNAITVTAGWTLVQFSQAAVTNPSVGFQIVTLNDSIAVDVVQNETGTSATSSIITTTASVTRAADVPGTNAPLTAQLAAGYSIIQTKNEATGTVARTAYAPGAFAWPAFGWVQSMAVYAPSVPASYVNAHLTVNGPY